MLANPALPLARPSIAAAVAVARDVLAAEAQGVAQAGRQLGAGFAEVLQALAACSGVLAVTGVGKSGHVGRKLAATLASTGTPATFMHASEAVHGDLGQLRGGDLVLALSHSGQTREVVQLIAPLRALDVPLLALTGAADSPLARAAQAAYVMPPLAEACPMNLVPTVSTATMMAVGDAWAMALMHLRGDHRAAYALRHPAGALGRKLQRVAQVMRTGAANPLAHQRLPVGQVLALMSGTPGRPGAATIVDDAGRLVGLFTDGDLRRLAAQGQLNSEAPIAHVMHVGPITVAPDDWLQEAAARLRAHGVDQLPVVDADHVPVGLLDVQDILAAQ